MNDEDTILHMLHSIDRKVQFVQFAMGPSTDRTRELIEQFFADHPHMQHNIIDVPKITPSLKHPDTGEWSEGYGFDDARNASTEGLDAFDWIFWMDTDEYLSGNIGRYLRGNCLDAYLIPQHHFTTQPRGAQHRLIVLLAYSELEWASLLSVIFMNTSRNPKAGRAYPLC